MDPLQDFRLRVVEAATTRDMLWLRMRRELGSSIKV